MATIAKGSITLVNVNDAYSVLFTPDSCAIKADFDGTNPDLTNAYTDITVVRGEEKHTFKLTLASFSNTAITYQQIAIDAYTKRIRLTSIPSDVLSGALTFTITTDDEFVADVTFTYSVIRETSMLDWILDWESNKTVIGDSYLISPKIFVGKKVENAEGLKTLTGVYIGPDDTNTAGIYGYKEGKDVFHINAKGAMLGGWNVLSDCITTSNENGTISLGADGNLFYRTNKNELVWSLFQDGSATFAKGNVMLNSDGSAVFTGSIKASSGNVGGWTIDENVLYNANIALNSAKHIIGVGGSNTFNVNNIKGSIQQHGGVYMFYDNANSYGLQGYLPSKNVGDNLYMIQSSFSLGSINRIASWDFDADSLYTGAKVNMQKKYTASSGDITIGSQGMRGNSWYIDTDGSVSFLKGEVQFAESSGSMVGWNLNAKRLSNPNVAIVSDTANAGIFMSVAEGTDFNSLASSSLTDYIDAHGGIYMKTKTDGVSFAAYDQNGYNIFKLRSNGVSSIANWNIENDALFVGSKKVDADSFTDAAGSMTFSSTGIRGNKWRLEADGSGSLAGDMISWNAAGEVDFKAKVSADNITAGTISACTIQSSADSPTWKLNPDGSGYLANENITWKSDGNLKIQGEIEAISGKIGGFDIHYNSIGLESYDNQSYGNNGMYLDENMICFNSGKRQAIFGCWNNLGLPVICRMTDQTDDYTAKVGLAIKITGSTDVNTAIEMGGGWLSGLNYKVQSEGFDKITAQKPDTPVPTELNVTLSRSVVCLHASTQFYWRSYANRNDDKKFETKARDVNITLPEMKHYDNGHVLMIKRGVNNNKDVYLIPGKSYQKHLNANGTSYETEGNTCILADNNTYVTDKLILDSEGDAMQLIYFRDLSVTIDNVKYNGVWVQWKNPRAW